MGTRCYECWGDLERELQPTLFVASPFVAKCRSPLREVALVLRLFANRSQTLTLSRNAKQGNPAAALRAFLSWMSIQRKYRWNRKRYQPQIGGFWGRHFV